MMKKTVTLLIIALAFVLALTSLQPAAAADLAKTKNPPNDKQTEQADLQATKQADQQSAKATKQAEIDDKQATKKAEIDAMQATKQAEQALKKAQKEAEKNGKKGPKAETFRGKVLSVDVGGFTLSLADGTTAAFVVDATTVFKIPGVKNASLANVNVGVQAAVSAVKDPTTLVLTAKSVHIIPGKPVHVHRVGRVTAYTAGVSITIEAKGELFTFLLTPETKILPKDRALLLKVGSWVTIISRRDVTGGALTAQGVVVHPDKFAVTETPTETPVVTETPTEAPTETPTEAPTETPTETPVVTETPNP